MTDDLLSLDEAAKLIPGADAGTLKRYARQGKLSVYRVGKTHSTTRADIEALIESCRVVRKVRTCGSVPLAPTEPVRLGSSSMDLSSEALDLALTRARQKRAKRSATT